MKTKKIHQDQLIFHRKAEQKSCWKKCRDSIKHAATLAKIQKRKASISASNFDGQQQNILFTSLCLCVRVFRVVVVAKFQRANGVYYYLV